MSNSHTVWMADTGNYELEELSIEVSNKCLLRCRHCSSGAGREMKGELTLEEHQRVMKEARELGATILSLSGGDPILLPNLADYLDSAVALGYERILLYTTGVTGLACVKGFKDWDYWRVNDNFAITSFLLDSGYADRVTLVFSLDSHDPITMDYIRGVGGVWHAVVYGIDAAVQEGFKAWAHYVPMVPNIEHLPKVRDLCVDLGVEKLSVLRFVPQTRGMANKDQLLPDGPMFDKLMRVIDRELTSPERKDLPTALRVGCPAEFRHKAKGTSIYEAGTGKAKLCHAGLDLILVRPDGAVHPCAAWKSLPTDSNVRNMSLKEIWDGDHTFGAIRTYLQYGYKGLDGVCKLCNDLDTCRGGCPAQRLHAFGHRIEDLYYPESDPLCPSRLYR